MICMVAATPCERVLIGRHRCIASLFMRLRRLMQTNRLAAWNTMTKQDKSKPQAGIAPSDTAALSPAVGPAPIGPSPASGPAVPSAAQIKDAPREQGARDGLVVASILLVSAAITMMCYSQLGLSLPTSLAAGVVALSLLMLIHKQVQKSAQIAELKAELAQTRQSVKPKTASPRAGVAPSVASPAPTSAEARIRELSRDIGNLVPRSDLAPAGQGASAQAASVTSDISAPRSFPSGDVAAELVAERAARQASRAAAQTSVAAAAKQTPETAASPASPAEATAGGIQAPKGGVVREQWSFRPRADAQASAADASDTTAASGGSSGGATRGGVATTIEGDLELVQRKIKELADEVNAAEALRAPKPARPAPRAKSTGNALEDSIGALRTAASNMRGRPSLGDFVPKSETPAFSAPQAAMSEPQQGFGELIIPATAERIAGSDPVNSDAGRNRDGVAPRVELPPLPDLPTLDFPVNSAPVVELPPRAIAIARAVEDDTMDVLLGPIVTLAEHSVTHYEMTVGLRSDSEERLDAGEDDFALIGGELDTQFDIARLNRAAALATRMNARDRDGSLLAEFFGSSMTSRAFLEAFARAYEARPRISAQLVLTLSQRGIDAFTPSAWQAVQDMHAFGFRLALDKVEHMGTDFTALQRSGFRFVRFDAKALLEGMTMRDRFVPADEIIQRATLAGLSIIASGIPDAETQRRLLDAGILLGQGSLFGAARPVNVDGGGPADQSAAA